MNRTIIILSALNCLTLAACSSESNPSSPPPNVGGAGAGATPSAGSAGTLPQAGSGGATGGSAGSGVAGAVGGSGGNAGALAGGAGGSGGSSGGAPSTAGAGGLAGAGGSGGVPASGGAGGMSGAAGEGAGSLDIAKALDGLRVDDGCGDKTVDTSVGAVCQHVTLTASGGGKFTKSASIAGVAGVTYDVTLRIRGVVEPTRITGGTRADLSTFQYRSMDWRKVPYTVGGAVANSTDADYNQWHIGVESPSGNFYLNDYQKTGHYIFALDYQVTIPMAANTKVTLDVTDRNERQIVNYEKYAVAGIPGSVNFGQFVQVSVVAVKPR